MTDVRVVPAGDFGESCVRAVLEATSGIKSPVVGLPTGNTPVALFECLAVAVRAGQADVSAWRPFAIDEYGGPREHSCSNRAFFRRYWDAIPGAAPVTQFDPEPNNIPGEVRRMERALFKVGGMSLAILGVGMNGHLAFNEPGSGRASTARRMHLHRESRASAAPCWGTETPLWGLTYGLSELLGARSVVVMANGSAKARIVAAALDGPETSDVPASFARGEHVVWVLDEAAARLLSG